MLGRCQPNVWADNMYATNALSYHIYDNYSYGPWKAHFLYTSYFLVSHQYYSTYGGFMRLFFLGSLNVTTMSTMVSEIPSMTMTKS